MAFNLALDSVSEKRKKSNNMSRQHYLLSQRQTHSYMQRASPHKGPIILLFSFLFFFLLFTNAYFWEIFSFVHVEQTIDGHLVGASWLANLQQTD